MKKAAIINPVVVLLTVLILSTGCMQKTSQPIAGASEMIQEMLDGRQIRFKFLF